MLEALCYIKFLNCIVDNKEFRAPSICSFKCSVRNFLMNTK